MAKKRGKRTKKCVACGRAIDARALTCRCGAAQPRPQENDQPEEQPALAAPSPTPTMDETMVPESTPKPKRTFRPKKTGLPPEQPAPEEQFPAPATVAAVAPEPPQKPKRAPRPTKKSELSAFVDAIEALGGLDAAREALDLLERAKRL